MEEEKPHHDPEMIREAETHIAEDTAVAATTGATAGSVLGPVGLAAGAVVGAVTGIANAFTHPHGDGREVVADENETKKQVIQERSS